MTDPTIAPAVIPGLPHVSRPPVLVTGGTGTLGRAVVAELLHSNVPARVLTHRPDADSAGDLVHGDLTTGEGLQDALEGVAAVIHCASDAQNAQQVDIEGTRRLTEMLRARPDTRLVHVSILGCWDAPLAYYRAKAASETVVVESAVPHAIVRASQFHPVVAKLLTPHAGMTAATSGLRFAPVDPAWVATRLVDLALADGAAPELVQLAGPEVLTARDAAVLTAHALGHRLRRHVTLPAVGPLPRALARGSNLPGPDAERGGATYAQWLGENRRQD